MIKIFYILTVFIFLSAFAMDSSHGLDGYKHNVIDAAKNARGHSNMGNIYFSEGNYVSALKEYEIAFNLTYDTSVSSTYLYNIARCYTKINNWNSAKYALLGAIEKDCMNITYYKALVDCFMELGTIREELDNYLYDNKNPYNKIVAGLIYLKLDKITSAKHIFHEFIIRNPDMLITEDIKRILKEI